MTNPYSPFLFPPNYELAQQHKRCTMPGLSKSPPIYCVCCGRKQKQPFKQWVSRSIEDDFKTQGGSVVTYFWLLKLYTFVIAFVLVLYGIYLTILIQENCDQNISSCRKFLGIWIISNQDLIRLLRSHEDQSLITRLLTLRGITFVILMLANAFSLVIAKFFKKIYPSKLSISDYSLLFKNCKQQPTQLILRLKQQFPDIDVKETLRINALEPYYSHYQAKINRYYQTINSQKLKQKLKFFQELQTLLKKCSEAKPKFHEQNSERIIVVLNSISQKQQVLQKYKDTRFLGMFGGVPTTTYCVSAPRPQQIIWNNIGSSESHKLKFTLLSIVYFVLLLGGHYLLLFLCMSIVYNQWLDEPWKTIAINVILTGLVIVALNFRQLMNRLAQLSHPSTYTYRTKFIVLTTISFHLLFYIIIPTFYFSWAEQNHKSDILAMISNQVMNFVIFQFIIVGIDLMHYSWNKRLKKVQNQAKPFACQKILHENIQYPRFPIQFKLIILFKLWSFTIFFAFQSPLILLLLLIVLIFLFFKDKHSLYYHYRMEIIHNRVQFSILRVYCTFFSIYMFVIFVLTQHVQIEFWLSLGFTVIMILFQLFVLGRNFQSEKVKIQQNGSLLLPPSFEELDIKQTYVTQYNNFVNKIHNQALSKQIEEYVNGNDVNSLQTTLT